MPLRVFVEGMVKNPGFSRDERHEARLVGHGGDRGAGGR